RETWPLRSKCFQAWLRQQYYERTWDAPNPAALNAALNALEAQAQFDGPELKVSLRLAEQDGLIRAASKSAPTDGGSPRSRRSGSAAAPVKASSPRGRVAPRAGSAGPKSGGLPASADHRYSYTGSEVSKFDDPRGSAAASGARRALLGHALSLMYNVVRVSDSSSRMVAFMSRKSESKTEIAAPSVPQRLTVFGPPLLLGGEDAAAHDQLLARICAAVKPVDIIDEIFIADVASLEWEVLRLRRLKWTLMQEPILKALKRFLAEQLESNYALHKKHFKRYLAELLRNNLPTEQADSAETLAAECAPHTDEANEKLDEVLGRIGLEMNTVLDNARAAKAKELVQEYVRGKQAAVTLVHKLLADAGESIDTFMAQALAEKIDVIERIDRLTTVAESRRNASLREIDRRRAVLGERLRRSVQEIEDDDFADGELVLELPPAEGKNAA